MSNPLSITALEIIDRVIENSGLMFSFYREGQQIAEDAIRNIGLEQPEGTAECETVFRIVKSSVESMDEEKFI